MFNNNIQIATIDLAFNDVNGIEDGKKFAINGKISIGISVNGSILNKVEPLVDAAIQFNKNKMMGKNKVQRMLDEVEMLRLEVEKARLQRQLRDLNK